MIHIMSASKLDAVYRSFVVTKFFTKGWGKPENLRRLFEFRKVISNRDECFKLISSDYPVTITKEETWSDCRVMEGTFTSPLSIFLPGIVPECAQQAHFQMVLPLKWESETYKPMCLHLAGTGDHDERIQRGQELLDCLDLGFWDKHIQNFLRSYYFWRRRNLMAKPLLKEAGIGAIILENPFYGNRKPKDQVRSCLHNVSDIFVMGGCLILESLVLFHWCERNGFGPLGVTGLSMGGHMASLSATNWPKPLVLVPCLSWSTASPVFTQGVMSQSINWELLETQYFSDGEYRENLAKMVTIVDEAFLAGQKFAKTLTSTVEVNQKAERVTNDTDISEPLKKVKEITDKLVDCDKLSDIIKKVDNSKESLLQRVELLEKLKISSKISHSLYKKITSDEKFELDEDEIMELNALNIKDIETSFGMINHSKVIDDSSLPVLPKDENIPVRMDGKISDKKIDEIFRSSVLREVHQKLNLSDNVVNVNPFEKQKLSNDNIAECNIHIGNSNAKELVKASENSIMKVGNPRNLTDITMEILGSIPLLLTKTKSTKVPKIHWRDREALQFMRGVMDECTHLSNFSVPFDTSLIIAVCARNDAYVPQEGCRPLEDVWPGAEIRYLDAGHVSAYVLHQKLFRSSIVEAFERSKQKWKDSKHEV